MATRPSLNGITNVAFADGGDSPKVKTAKTSDYIDALKKLKTDLDTDTVDKASLRTYYQMLARQYRTAQLGDGAGDPAQLKKQLDLTKNLLDNFDKFASQSGDGSAISEDDIRSLAGKDGDARTISQADFDSVVVFNQRNRPTQQTPSWYVFDKIGQQPGSKLLT